MVGTNPVATDTAVTISATPPGQIAGPATFTDGTSNTIAFGETSKPLTTAVLTVSAPVPSQLSLNPISAPGGASVTGTVVLTGRAPARGLVLGLSGGSSDVAVPPNIDVPVGADRQDFQIATHPVGSARTVTISVVTLQQLQQISSDGSVRLVAPGNSNAAPITANLSLTPSLTVTAQPSPATGGAPVAITLMVQPDPASPIALTLTTDHPELLQVPATVAGPPQTTTAPQRIIVNVPTGVTSIDQGVTITASRGPISASTSLLIKQTPPPISSFTLRPGTVHGGSNIISQLTLSNTAPASVAVSFTTDHPELVTVPATVTLARSTIPSSLTFRTAPATVQTTVTISASVGTQTTSTTVTVVP